jgi:hypothetical protein
VNNNTDINNTQRVKSSFTTEAAFSRFAMLHHSGQQAILISYNQENKQFTHRLIQNPETNNIQRDPQQLLISIPDIQFTLVPNTLFHADSTSAFLSGQLNVTPPGLVARHIEIPSLHATLVYGVDAHLLSRLEALFPNAYVTVPAESLLNHWSLLSKTEKFHSFTAVHWFKNRVYISLWKDRKLEVFTGQNITSAEDIAYFTFNILEQYTKDDETGPLIYGGDAHHREAATILSKYHGDAKPDYFLASTPDLPLAPGLDNGELTHLLSLILCA